MRKHMDFREAFSFYFRSTKVWREDCGSAMDTILRFIGLLSPHDAKCGISVDVSGIDRDRYEIPNEKSYELQQSWSYCSQK